MPVPFLVTGASGFVGRALCAALPAPVRVLRLGAPDWETSLREAPLAGATIFHLAARVHDPLERDDGAFQRDNAGKTRTLAQAAVRQGARRMVFLSTIKVNGEETHAKRFRDDDEPAPEDAYARSKLDAERGLAEIAAAGGLEWSVVRAPLVIGPGAKGNLASLLRLADSPWPLPFAAIANRRSFVHLTDLVRLLIVCGEHSAANGRTFLAAHPRSVSTAELVATLRRALGRAERLFALPPGVIEAMAGLLGQGARARRLTRSLEVDPSFAQARLGWVAAVDPSEAAAEMARHWRETYR